MESPYRTHNSVIQLAKCSYPSFTYLSILSESFSTLFFSLRYCWKLLNLSRSIQWSHFLLGVFQSYAIILLNGAVADEIAVIMDAFVLQRLDTKDTISHNWLLLHSRLIIIPPTLAYLSNGLCTFLSDRVCFVSYSIFVTYLPHSVLMLAVSFTYRCDLSVFFAILEILKLLSFQIPRSNPSSDFSFEVTNSSLPHSFSYVFDNGYWLYH